MHRVRPMATPATRALPIGLLAAGSVVFATILAQVLTGGRLVALDHRVSASVTPIQDQWQTDFAQILADAGHLYVQGGVLVLIAAALSAQRRSWAPVLVAVLGVGLLGGATLVVKQSVDRVGPLGTVGAFPSGHTVTAVVAGGIVVRLLGQGRPRTVLWPLALLACAWALLVGWSRVHLNVHWLSDVLAGGALGLAVLGAVLLVAPSTAGRRAG